MSGDEIVALLVSLIFAIAGWNAWVRGLFFLQNLSRKLATQLLAWLAPLAAGIILLFVLRKWSSHDVPDDPVYIFFYMVMGLGWTGLWNLLLPLAGLSFRDDALERGNDAAGFAISGGLLGATLAFAGANIGEGPGWWVVVFCAALATTVMLSLWMIGSRITGAQEYITVDRDTAAGWRAAGYFIGAGLILGRAVAGDWHSSQETLQAFLVEGWPVLLIWANSIVLDIAAKPKSQRPAPNPIVFGFIPFLIQ